MQRLNNLFSKLSNNFPWLYALAYRLPFSPHRGMTWRFLDKSVHSVLDIGIFRGAVGKLIRLNEKERHFILGVDLYRPYLVNCKKHAVYDALVLADARFLPFKESTFDAVMALEVIEHLPKSDGVLFLETLERLAKRQVILSTPVGFMKLHNLDSEYQEHLSGWAPSEFKTLGWTIRGMCGIRMLPKTLSYYISFLIPLSYYVPICAYDMLCINKKRPLQ